MRIYDRQSFLKLPEGTIFAQGVPWAFDGLRIKGGTLHIQGRANDFWSCGPADIESKDSDDMCRRMDRMLAEGTSEPICNAYSRGSSYDDKDVFLVFEREDLLHLMEQLIKAAQVTPT